MAERHCKALPISRCQQVTVEPQKTDTIHSAYTIGFCIIFMCLVNYWHLPMWTSNLLQLSWQQPGEQDPGSHEMSAGLVQNMTVTYHYYLDEISDPRVSKWWLMDSPWQLLAILSCYLYFSRVGGPRFMRSRKPFHLRTVIAVYNVFQIVGSFLVFISLLSVSWRRNITLGCEVVDYSNDPDAVRLVSLFWYGTVLRMVDLTETAFFVLRKKFTQASFLHLYHHTTSLVLLWLTTKYAGGGVSVFPLMANSLVHTAMYTYYLLSSLGVLPATELVLRWKMRLTKLQMAQFVVLIIHSLNTLLTDCLVPTTLSVIHTVNLAMNFYLFYGFYRRAYKPSIKCAMD